MILEKEHHVLHNVELNNHQKQVVAKAIEAGGLDKPVRVPLDDPKLVNARDMLDELGVITYSYADNTITVEQDSVELLKMEGIIDEAEQLTDEGRELANGKNNNGEMTESMSFSSFLNSDLLLLNR